MGPEIQPMPKKLKSVNEAIDTAAELLIRLSEQHGDIEMRLTDPETEEVTGVLLVSTHVPAAQAMAKAYRQWVEEHRQDLDHVYEAELKGF